MTEAYPLQWPDGWPRTPSNKRRRGKFGSNFGRSRDMLLHQFKLMNVPSHTVVVSSWLPLRRDGLPYAEQARRPLEDPGVAVYFTLRGKQMAMARDAYDTPFDNLHSLKIAIEHLRGLERHGGGTMMERAFEGFQAIAAPGAMKHWREIIGIPPSGVVTLDVVEAAYRSRARKVHPDAGGSQEEMAALNAAIERARAELSP